MNEIKLKPCPFCASVLVGLDEISDWVECRTCYATASFDCWQNPTGRIENSKLKDLIEWLKSEIDGLDGIDATFDLSHDFVENLRNQLEEIKL